MTAMKFVSKLFKFKGFGAVDVCFEGHGEEAAVVVSVQPHNNGCRCPQCGRRGKIVRVMEPRRWRDVRICGRTVWLYHRPREIRCPTHGRHVEEVPWAAPSARVSYRFEYLLLKYCQWMPQATAARLLGLAPSTLSDQLHRLIERRRSGHRIGALTTLGIDEISYAKGHKYATLVYDLERSCVVWIGKGKAPRNDSIRSSGTISAPSGRTASAGPAAMSETFIGAIRQHCPNAQLILDRFHVVKALNEAVDEVRKEQWRQASGEDRKLLKGLRWVLLHHSAQRSPKDQPQSIPWDCLVCCLSWGSSPPISFPDAVLRNLIEKLGIPDSEVPAEIVRPLPSIVRQLLSGGDNLSQGQPSEELDSGHYPLNGLVIVSDQPIPGR